LGGSRGGLGGGGGGKGGFFIGVFGLKILKVGPPNFGLVFPAKKGGGGEKNLGAENCFRPVSYTGGSRRDFWRGQHGGNRPLLRPPTETLLKWFNFPRCPVGSGGPDGMGGAGTRVPFLPVVFWGFHQMQSPRGGGGGFKGGPFKKKRGRRMRLSKRGLLFRARETWCNYFGLFTSI